MTVSVPTIALSNGLHIPAIGYGIGSAWRIKKTNNNDNTIPVEKKLEINRIVVESIQNAIKAGFKLIDGAEAYFTRRELAQAKSTLVVPRNSLFITDKYSNSNRLRESYVPVEEALNTALTQADTGYFDLWMLHSLREPAGSRPIEERWKLLEKAYKEGKARSLGVSNCSKGEIERILKIATIKPHVLQLYFHTLCQHFYDDLLELASEHQIVVEAYSALAPLTKRPPEGESIPAQEKLLALLGELTEKYKKTNSQILLRWTYQRGFVPITTSSKAKRIKESLEIFDFELEKEDEQNITEVGKDSQEFFGNHIAEYNKFKT